MHYLWHNLQSKRLVQGHPSRFLTLVRRRFLRLVRRRCLELLESSDLRLLLGNKVNQLLHSAVLEIEKGYTLHAFYMLISVFSMCQLWD